MPALHTRCPNCNDEHDVLSALQKDRQVDPGSISICINCGQVSVFEENMILRKITSQEITEINKRSPEDYRKILVTTGVIKEQRKRF